MPRERLEVADIFRAHGPAWRRSQAGHLSLGQLKVMSAIERCRTAALGGHVARCQDCAHIQIAYNSCRNRHCPKCQGAAAKDWLAARQAELLPVPYYHVVFTLPAQIADIAYQNKAEIYGILFKAAAETLITIAADPRHLGARIGLTAVLHTWGSALTHHPHVHCIVPGGGLSPAGDSWISCRPGFFLPVRVLSRCSDGCSWRSWQRHTRPSSCSSLASTQDYSTTASSRLIWHRYAKSNGWSTPSLRSAGPRRSSPTSRATPTGSPSRTAGSSGSTHNGVTFKWKDYRAKGRDRQKVMTLATDEFIRRFLIHVLPSGFHRIRHYGLFANGGRSENLARLRELFDLPAPSDQTEPDTEADETSRPRSALPLLRRSHWSSSRRLSQAVHRAHRQPALPVAHDIITGSRSNINAGRCRQPRRGSNESQDQRTTWLTRHLSSMAKSAKVHPTNPIWDHTIVDQRPIPDPAVISLPSKSHRPDVPLNRA